MQEQLQPCALRALTVCDGQVLEDPDRGLTMCLCRIAVVAEAAGDGQLARDSIDLRERWRQRFERI